MSYAIDRLNNKKYPTISKDSAVLWWALSPYTPDPQCFPSDIDPSRTVMEKLKKYTSDKLERYQIILSKTADIEPIHIKITLLQDNCEVTRGFGYCLNFKSINGTESGSTGISCNDGSVGYIVPVSGISGTFEDCMLSYNAVSKIRVTTSVRPEKCNYEIYYY